MPPDIRLTDVQAFVEVSRTLNYSKAADALFYSEPGVYLQVRAIEKALGIKLFSRASGTLALTAAGKALLDPAKAILDELAALKVIAHDLRAQASQHVRLGAGRSTGAYLVPPLLADFSELYPDVEVDLRVLPGEQILRGVAEADLDLGVLGILDAASQIGKRAADRLVYKPWRRANAVAVASPRYLRRRPRLGKSSSPVILFIAPYSRNVSARLADAWQRQHISVSIVEIDSTEAVKQLTLSGLGASLIGESQIAAELESGRLIALPFEPSALESTTYIVRRRQMTENGATAQLLAFFWGLRDIEDDRVAELPAPGPLALNAG